MTANLASHLLILVNSFLENNFHSTILLFENTLIKHNVYEMNLL